MAGLLFISGIAQNESFISWKKPFIGYILNPVILIWSAYLLMRSISSSLAFVLLLLVQILAPLLHAHTSGNFGNGFLHVPGLESLYLAHNNTSVRSPKMEPSEGFVVDIAQGLRQPFDACIAFASSHEAILHELPLIPPIALAGRFLAYTPASAVINDNGNLSPPSRAPPV
jgi:hypothetical protein